MGGPPVGVLHGPSTRGTLEDAKRDENRSDLARHSRKKKLSPSRNTRSKHLVGFIFIFQMKYVRSWTFVKIAHRVSVLDLMS